MAPMPPVSPHVNVPNTHNFNHMPPPLPPRVKRRESTSDTSQQIKQVIIEKKSFLTSSIGTVFEKFIET